MCSWVVGQFFIFFRRFLRAWMRGAVGGFSDFSSNHAYGRVGRGRLIEEGLTITTATDCPLIEET